MGAVSERNKEMTEEPDAAPGGVISSGQKAVATRRNRYGSDAFREGAKNAADTKRRTYGADVHQVTGRKVARLLLERTGGTFYRDNNQRAQEVIRQRATEDPGFYKRRSAASVDAARANGTLPPPLEKVCIVPSCGTTFTMSRQYANNRRCRDCIAQGRNRCDACGQEMEVSPTHRGQAKCEECRIAKRSVVQGRRTKWVTLTCTGVKKIDRKMTVTTPDAVTHSVQMRFTYRDVVHVPTCQKEHEYLPSQARQLSHYDEEARTYQCKPCSSRELADALLLAEEQVLRPHSYRSLERTEKAVATVRRNKEGRRREKLRKGIPKKDVPWNLAPLVSLGPTGAVAGGGRTVAAWPKDPAARKREVSLCPWCSKLVLNQLCPTAQRRDFHWACWKEWLRSTAGHEWTAEHKRLRRAGYSKEQVQRQVPDARDIIKRVGRAVDHERLNDAFRWTLLHYLANKQVQEIAEDAGYTRSTVSEAIKDIMTRRLPEPELCGRLLRASVHRLRVAASTRA